MKTFPLVIILLIFVLTGCKPAIAAQTPNIDTSNLVTQQPSDSVPVPGDAALMRGSVILDSTELLTLEGMPLQFTLTLKGSLPTPCHALRVAVSPPDLQNKIVVDVYSVVDPNTICAQSVEPFEENFPLGSFPSGNYTLWVNGEKIAEFVA